MSKQRIRLREYMVDGAVFQLASADKTAVLRELAEKACELGWMKHEECSGSLFKLLEKREKLGSTGIIPHIAIPHCKSDDISENLILLVGYSPDGVPFDSQDGNPVKLFFTVITRRNMPTIHLGTLAAISRLISSHGLSARIDAFLDADKLKAILDECEYEI